MKPFACLRLTPAQPGRSLPVLLLAAALPWFAPLAGLAQDSADPPPADTPEGGANSDALPAQQAPQHLNQDYQLSRAETSSQPGTALATEVPAGARYANRLQRIVKRASSSGPGPNNALIVLSSSADAKAQPNLQEDLAVMSHILDKAIDDKFGSEQPLRKAMGVELFFSPDAGSLRNSYFEGYGALFLLRVNFPLLPPPAKTETQKEEPPVTSAWEEARQEVLGAPGAPGPNPAPAEPYSEEKVNRLKTALFDALKNAANIRHLKPDEGVTLCVFGGSKSDVDQANVVRQSSAGGRGEWMVLQNVGTPPRATILTLRAKKADIDAFAKGQINPDDFHQKVASATYEADTGAAGVGGFGGGMGGFGGYGGSGGGGSARTWGELRR